jgi:hypothetical protein
MYQNSAAATQRIAEFLGMDASPEVIQKVVANSSIDEMRAKASIGLNHLRKGGYGGWRTSFTVAMSEFFDDVSSNFCFVAIYPDCLIAFHLFY